MDEAPNSRNAAVTAPVTGAALLLAGYLADALGIGDKLGLTGLHLWGAIVGVGGLFLFVRGVEIAYRHRRLLDERRYSYDGQSGWWVLCGLILGILGIVLFVSSPQPNSVTPPSERPHQSGQPSETPSELSPASPESLPRESQNNAAPPTGISLDSSFIGSWTGIITPAPEADSSATSDPYPIRLTLTSGSAGDAVGYFTLPTACGDDLKLKVQLVAANSTLAYLTNERPGCVPFDSFHLRREPGEQGLQIDAFNNQRIGTGSLH